MCSRNVLSSKTRSARAHFGSSGAAVDAAESRARLRTAEAADPESVAESSPERRETVDGDGRGLARCLFAGDCCGLLVAGGRFCAPPARDAEMP